MNKQEQLAEQIAKYRRRPFGYPLNVIRQKNGFKPVPYAHKKVVVGRFTLTIPFKSGKYAYLELPANYCDRDIEIILAQLQVIEMSFEKILTNE